MKARNKAGMDLPPVYQRHLLATRLGLSSWDEVEEMPHLDLVLRLELMRIDDEVAEWRRKHPGY